MKRSGITTRVIDKAVQDFFTKQLTFLYEDRYAKDFSNVKKLYDRFLIRIGVEHLHAMDLIHHELRISDGIHCSVILNKSLFFAQFKNLGFKSYENNYFFMDYLTNDEYRLIPKEESAHNWLINQNLPKHGTLIDMYFLITKFEREHINLDKLKK